MALSLDQQFLTAIEKSSFPLVITKPDASADAIASMLALGAWLKSRKKQPTLVAPDHIPETWQAFLGNTSHIVPTLANIRKSIIDVDIEKAHIGELSYKMNDHRLSIYITTKDGEITDDQVRVHHDTYKHDLIIVVGAQDLPSLGEAFSRNSAFFSEIAIVAIDHSPANEHFGHINMIDITASATTEILYHLIKTHAPDILTEDIATMLLSGIISATRSFKSDRVSPRTLTCASELVTLGGKRELIMNSLYNNKSVQALQLWGKTLAHLTYEPSIKLYSTTLSQRDMIDCGESANEQELIEVVEELVKTAPDAEVILLLYEKASQEICGLLWTRRAHDALNLTASVGGTGVRDFARFCLINKNLVDAQQEMITSLRTTLE